MPAGSSTLVSTGILLSPLSLWYPPPSDERLGSDPLSLGGTGDLRQMERQQMSLCKAAYLGRETLRRSCMILCYIRYGASAVPFQGMGMTAHLFQVTPGHS